MFTQGEELKGLECRPGMEHVFHEECIVQWFKKKPECPMCRKNYFGLLTNQQPEELSSE